MSKLNVIEETINELKGLINLSESIRVECASADLSELLDTGWKFQRLYDELGELRKSIDTTSKFAQSQANMQMMVSSTMEVEAPEYVARPKFRKWYRLPSTKDIDGYSESLQSIGVPKQLADSQVVRFHGPGMADYYGENPDSPLPVGCNSSKVSNVEAYIQYRERKAK